MAFMMPVVRNDYSIYDRSRRASPERSNAGSPLGSGSLSTSPNMHAGSGEEARKMFRTSEHLDIICGSPHRSRSGSFSSVKKFHHLLVDTLKRAALHTSHNHLGAGAPCPASGSSTSVHKKEDRADDGERPYEKEDEEGRQER